METNGSSSSNPTRVQLPSIKNLVDTLPPPNVYRSLQVTPEFAPHLQRRSIQDAGGFSTRPLHASPAPPSRSATTGVSSTAPPYAHAHTHGQEMSSSSHQASTNDVIQARSSRMPLPGPSSQNQGPPPSMRANQDHFHERSSRIDSPSSRPRSLDPRRHTESFDAPGIASQHAHARTQGQQRQGQGSYGLSSNPHSRGFGDMSTSAFISASDRGGGGGVSHLAAHDLRVLSSSETQSRVGGQYLKPQAERVLPARNGPEYDEYDAPALNNTPWDRHPHGNAIPDWERIPKSNSQPSRHREGYDAPVIDHGRYRPDSVDRSQHLQREHGPVAYQERRADQYTSRAQYNLEPARWQHDYGNHEERSGSSSRDSYYSSNFADAYPSNRGMMQGRHESRPMIGGENWDSQHVDRASGRKPNYYEQENYAPRLERVHPSVEADRLHKKRRMEVGAEERSHSYNGYLPSAMLPSSRPPPMKDLTRHRSKEDSSRVFVELTNEARGAINAGGAMKKIHEFSDVVAQFGSYAKQQASRATIQDLQEMSLRIELIFRMARELQKGKKQTVVAVTRQEPAVVQQIVAPPAQKKTPAPASTMTKEQKRVFDDMEKIRKKRTSAQAGIKSKYMKRNKKTQPPKKCSSCGIKETPEWRKGPEGPRSLCNACGLHYAKLMRNRSSANEGKWIGTGSAPPIDIVTLRQVTGVGIQPQPNERGEYEIPGIYTHIPPSRMLTGQFIPARRYPPPSTSTSQSALQGQASTSTAGNEASTSTAVNPATNDNAEMPPPAAPEPKPDESAGPSQPTPASESKTKKRKAPSDDEADDIEVSPPTKRQRVSSPQMEDVQMQHAVQSNTPAGSTQSPHPNDDSPGERSF